MSGKLFDDLTEVYEALVDWPRRLAREEPFYRRWFQRCDVHRVLDTACGTGHHAAMFHRWGLTVQGADLSTAMIAQARDRYGEPPGLRWAVRSFDQPQGADEPFDAAICAGNSLALAPDRPTVQRALQQMLAAVRPAGLVVVHVLNLWRLPDGPCVWQSANGCNGRRTRCWPSRAYIAMASRDSSIWSWPIWRRSPRSSLNPSPCWASRPMS